MAKNITLSANDFLIKRAREKARQENTSLNQLFRDWVKKYVNRDNIDTEYDTLMQSLADVKAGRKFSRDEMNAR
ncbi:MAG TPA: hypothetical protein ENK96_02825 [Desulfobulbaceae bacterium]|nr:hypothetical protein [Desulfobulbaceae bacterium]